MRDIERQFREQLAEASVAPELSSLADGSLRIPSPSPSFGDIEIELHDREITIHLGEHTHCHFSEYSDQPQGHHIEEAAQFITSVVSDEVVVWSLRGRGGCHAVGGEPLIRVPAGALRVRWSGPLE